MLIANDINGNRINPSKGSLGFCPLCKSSVLAICGEINIWHWRHENLQNCDRWNDGETEWHLKWKNEFPTDWQEVIMKDDFSEHRADVKITNNLVLELQNSSISSTEIKIRENFYGKMVWLINAIEFKNNFHLRSIVKRVLSNHEEYDPEYQEYEYYRGNEFYELQELFEESTELIIQTENLNNKILNLNNLIEKINKIEENDSFVEFEYSSYLENYDFKFKEIIREINKKIDQLKIEVTKINNKVTTISLLPNSNHINYEKYKLCNFQRVSESGYPSGVFIEKNYSFFPEVITYKTNYIYQQLAKNTNYEFIVDFDNILKSYDQKLSEINSNILNNENNISSIFNEHCKKIESQLNVLKINFQDEEKKIIVKQEKVYLLINDKQNIIERLEIEDQKIFYQNKEKDKMKFENRKFELMKKYKGQYEFFWKNKRKSWDHSQKPKFLDFGDFIYEIISEKTLKKMTKIEFIDYIKDHK